MHCGRQPCSSCFVFFQLRCSMQHHQAVSRHPQWGPSRLQLCNFFFFIWQRSYSTQKKKKSLIGANRDSYCPFGGAFYWSAVIGVKVQGDDLLWEKPARSIFDLFRRNVAVPRGKQSLHLGHKMFPSLFLWNQPLCSALKKKNKKMSRTHRYLLHVRASAKILIRPSLVTLQDGDVFFFFPLLCLTLTSVLFFFFFLPSSAFFIFISRCLEATSWTQFQIRWLPKSKFFLNKESKVIVGHVWLFFFFSSIASHLGKAAVVWLGVDGSGAFPSIWLRTTWQAPRSTRLWS